MTQPRHIGDVVMTIDNISLAFGGVKALSEVSFAVREHEIRAIIGPNGAGQELDAQRDQRRLSSAAGQHYVQGR